MDASCILLTSRCRPQSSLNHDECMKTFSDAGVYVILDLGLPLNGSINRASPTWDTALQTEYLKTLDAFLPYDNLLAVSVGNEVIANDATTSAAPFVKAAARDMKAYLRSKNSGVLVTYSGADAPAGANGRRKLLADYLACGTNETSIDFYGHNSYAWCGDSSLADSGYSTLASDFADYPIPMIFSEVGCVPSAGADSRPWTEINAIFSPPMTDSFSGAVAFQYFPKDPSAEGKDYGLVSFEGGDVVKRADWATLKSQFAGVNPSTAASTSRPALPACNEQGTGAFAASSQLPPTPDVAYCSCLESTAWPCVARPSARDNPAILGLLTNQACGFLGQAGSSCSAITANGSTGTYGNISFCSPVQRLDWAFSSYYQATNNNAQSCDFSGNATLKANANSSAAGSRQAAAACASQNAVGVKTPADPDEASSSSDGGGGGSSTSSQDGNGATTLPAKAGGLVTTTLLALGLLLVL